MKNTLGIEKIVAQLKAIEGDLFFYAVVIESSDDAIIQQDLDGVIVSWNKGAERMYGYTAKEIVSESIAILNPPELPEDFHNMIASLQSGERIDHYETKRRRKNKSSVDVSITVWPIKNHQGMIIGASIIARDISDHLELRSRTQLMSMASRELKRNITGLRGYLKVLHRHLLNNGETNLLPKIKKIDEQVIELINLIDDLLDVSPGKNPNQTAYTMKEFNLESVIQDSLKKVRPTSETQKISFKSQPMKKIYGDPDRIEQVILSLLNNAIKYSPHHGEITISIEKDPTHVCISIKDLGIGIESENLQKIFNPYYQVRNAQNKAIPGLGIGLSSARDIILHHHGMMWAESEKGHGSTVFFTLPLNQPQDNTSAIDYMLRKD